MALALPTKSRAVDDECGVSVFGLPRSGLAKLVGCVMSRTVPGGAKACATPATCAANSRVGVRITAKPPPAGLLLLLL